MRIATISWSDAKGEASVLFASEFENLHYVTKLDALQDALHAINEKYNEVYGMMHRKLEPIPFVGMVDTGEEDDNSERRS